MSKICDGCHRGGGVEAICSRARLRPQRRHRGLDEVRSDLAVRREEIEWTNRGMHLSEVIGLRYRLEVPHEHSRVRESLQIDRGTRRTVPQRARRVQ